MIAADESLKIEQIDDAQRYLRAIGTSKVRPWTPEAGDSPRLCGA